ncbi:hypothetical protein D3C72_1931340 [compost metagenome]
MEKWHELSEHELDQTHGNVNSILDLMEKKLGLAFEEASRKMSEMTSHYHLYDEPEEDETEVENRKPIKERILEINPGKQPKDRPVKPRDRSM